MYVYVSTCRRVSRKINLTTQTTDTYREYIVQSVLGMTKVAVTPRGSIYTLPIFDYKTPGQFNATLEATKQGLDAPLSLLTVKL